MTAGQAAFLTSRVISLWLAYRAFLSLLALPTGFLWYSVFPAYELAMGTHSRFGSRVLIGSGISLAQLFVEIILAIVFYRFGPRVAEFLLGEDAKAD
jgi:hypothetical protein